MALNNEKNILNKISHLTSSRKECATLPDCDLIRWYFFNLNSVMPFLVVQAFRID